MTPAHTIRSFAPVAPPELPELRRPHARPAHRPRPPPKDGAGTDTDTDTDTVSVSVSVWRGVNLSSGLQTCRVLVADAARRHARPSMRRAAFCRTARTEGKRVVQLWRVHGLHRHHVLLAGGCAQAPAVILPRRRPHANAAPQDSAASRRTAANMRSVDQWARAPVSTTAAGCALIAGSRHHRPRRAHHRRHLYLRHHRRRRLGTTRSLILRTCRHPPHRRLFLSRRCKRVAWTSRQFQRSTPVVPLLQATRRTS